MKTKIEFIENYMDNHKRVLSYFMEKCQEDSPFDDTIKDKPKILVASFGTLSTGVSIKDLHNIVFMESFKSEQIIIQSIGRGLRLHKTKDSAVIFDIVDVFDAQFKSKNIL